MSIFIYENVSSQICQTIPFVYGTCKKGPQTQWTPTPPAATAYHGVTTQVVFFETFVTDVSMISVSSVEVMFARAVLIVFSTAGSGLSISTISGSSTHMTGPLNHEFVNKVSVTTCLP